MYFMYVVNSTLKISQALPSYPPENPKLSLLTFIFALCILKFQIFKMYFPLSAVTKQRLVMDSIYITAMITFRQMVLAVSKNSKFDICNKIRLGILRGMFPALFLSCVAKLLGFFKPDQKPIYES